MAPLEALGSIAQTHNLMTMAQLGDDLQRWWRSTFYSGQKGQLSRREALQAAELFGVAASVALSRPEKPVSNEFSDYEFPIGRYDLSGATFKLLQFNPPNEIMQKFYETLDENDQWDPSFIPAWENMSNLPAGDLMFPKAIFFSDQLKNFDLFDGVSAIFFQKNNNGCQTYFAIPSKSEAIVTAEPVDRVGYKDMEALGSTSQIYSAEKLIQAVLDTGNTNAIAVNAETGGKYSNSLSTAITDLTSQYAQATSNVFLKHNHISFCYSWSDLETNPVAALTSCIGQGEWVNMLKVTRDGNNNIVVDVERTGDHVNSNLSPDVIAAIKARQESQRDNIYTLKLDQLLPQSICS